SRDRLIELLEAGAGTRIAIVGDAMLDVYLRGDVDRISPEAPVPVVRIRDKELALGGAAKRTVYSLQEFFVLAGKALGFIFVKPFYAADLFQQMDAIGVGSLGIVLLTGFFTGMVLALQSAVQLKTFGATMYIGRLIAASMIRE